MAADDEKFDHRKQLANWCFTLYQKDLKELPELKHHPDVQYCVYQTEKCPRTGRLHLQGFIQLKNRKRMTTVKLIIGYDWVNLRPMAKGSSPEQAADYCKKQDSKHPGPSDEYGELRKAGQRTDLLRLKTAIFEEKKSFIDLTKDDEHFSSVARCPSFTREVIQIRDDEEAQAALKAQFEEAELRPWQDELTGLCQERADTRTVMWVCDEVGNAGKSFWASYMSACEDGLVLAPSTFPNMAYLYKIADKKTTTVIVDVTRSSQDDAMLLSALQFAEACKNGHVISTKYQPAIIRRPAPHVVFLANFWPPTDKLSKDRWCLFHLKDQELIYKTLEELPMAYAPLIK